MSENKKILITSIAVLVFSIFIFNFFKLENRGIKEKIIGFDERNKVEKKIGSSGESFTIDKRTVRYSMNLYISPCWSWEISKNINESKINFIGTLKEIKSWDDSGDCSLSSIEKIRVDDRFDDLPAGSYDVNIYIEKIYLNGKKENRSVFSTIAKII